MAYKDPEAAKANDRKYRADHCEEMRKYRADHREERITYNRKWYAEHHEEQLAYDAKRRSEHPEELEASRRKYLSTDSGYAQSRASVSRRAARNRGAVVDAGFTNVTLAGILRDHPECAWCATPTPLHSRMIDHKRAICFRGCSNFSDISTPLAL